MRIVFAFILCFAFATVTGAEDAIPVHLMPLPAHVQVNPGQLTIDPAFTVSITGATTTSAFAAGRNVSWNKFAPAAGMVPLDLKNYRRGKRQTGDSRRKASKEIPELGEDESYTLEIASSGAKLNAPTTLGALRGLQTFRQLLQTTPAGFAVPAVSIQDAPRFPWRGLMIDVGPPLHAT